MSLDLLLSLHRADWITRLACVGWLTAIALGVALLVRAARWPARPWGRLATAMLGCLGVGLAASTFLLVDARREMTVIALGRQDSSPPRPYQFHFGWSGATEGTTVILFVAGVGLASCAALLVLCAIVAAVRAESRLRITPLRLALLITVSGLALGMGLVAIRLSEATAALDPPFPLSPLASLQAFDAIADEALAAARTYVVGVTAGGWIACVLTSLRGPRRPFGGGAAIGAGALFVVGVVAFAAVRGHAYDARHRIPSDRVEHLGCPEPVFDVRSLPVADQSEPLLDASLLELQANEALLHGGGGRPASPADLGDQLRLRCELWVELTRRPASAMPRLNIVAPAALSTVDIARWLRAIEPDLAQGFFLVVIEPERRLVTRTLGELPATPHCGGIPVLLDPASQALTSYPTWGDLARDHRDGGSPLRIRLR